MDQYTAHQAQTQSSFTIPASPMKDMHGGQRGQVGYVHFQGRTTNNSKRRIQKVFDNLSLSHEEKALRNRFGNNIESNILSVEQTSLLTPMRLRNSTLGNRFQKHNGRGSARNDNGGRKTTIGTYSNQQRADSGLIQVKNSHSTSHLRMPPGAGNDLGGPGYNSLIGAHYGLPDRYMFNQEKLANM